MSTTHNLAEENKSNSNFVLPLHLVLLIYDYLQNKEKKEIYKYFNLPKPIRPLIYLENENPFAFLTDKKDHSTGHNTYYIEHKDSFRLTTKHLSTLSCLAVNLNYSFRWRCPVCREFIPLVFQFYFNGSPPGVRGWSIRYDDNYDINTLCHCRMIELEQDAQFRGDEVKT